MSIQARYADSCPACWGWIREGDQIRRRSDGTGWIHDECPAEDDLAPNHAVCETCWLTHPEGACDR